MKHSEDGTLPKVKQSISLNEMTKTSKLEHSTKMKRCLKYTLRMNKCVLCMCICINGSVSTSTVNFEFIDTRIIITNTKMFGFFKYS